ncbi:MAG: ABC transporter ATP-binding protein [Firmicutes bacterium]|nr:ABC transporter ATP-binding protein [Bacillota bacterium]
MRTAATILDFQHVTKKFGKTIAVNDVTFQVKEGEVYGLLGPNGAGKTTVIKSIVGHLRPSSGSITISSYDLQKEFADAIDFVGAVVEYPMHYEYMSGYQNLKLTANMYPEVTKARIEEVIELVGLQGRIDEPVRKYSLGMRQRLALAQSILNYPQLLILDEPMNGLDPLGMRDLRNLLRSLAANGMSILVSSHILEEMELMCDRIGIMSHGYMIAERNMDEIHHAQTPVYLVRVNDPEEALKLLSEEYGEQLHAKEAVGGRIEVETTLISASQINRILIKAGIEVQEIHEKKQSLEELYLQLTGGAEIE